MVTIRFKKNIDLEQTDNIHTLQSISVNMWRSLWKPSYTNFLWFSVLYIKSQRKEHSWKNFISLILVSDKLKQMKMNRTTSETTKLVKNMVLFRNPENNVEAL